MPHMTCKMKALLMVSHLYTNKGKFNISILDKKHQEYKENARKAFSMIQCFNRPGFELKILFFEVNQMFTEKQ